MSVAGNISAKKSRILDVDFALGTSAMVRHGILQQAGVAMTSQAGQINVWTAQSLLG